jgi:hypothetical protein
MKCVTIINYLPEILEAALRTTSISLTEMEIPELLEAANRGPSSWCVIPELLEGGWRGMHRYVSLC